MTKFRFCVLKIRPKQETVLLWSSTASAWVSFTNLSPPPICYQSGLSTKLLPQIGEHAFFPTYATVVILFTTFPPSTSCKVPEWEDARSSSGSVPWIHPTLNKKPEQLRFRKTIMRIVRCLLAWHVCWFRVLPHVVVCGVMAHALTGEVERQAVESADISAGEFVPLLFIFPITCVLYWKSSILFQIPKIYWDLSTKRVLLMELLEGGQVDDKAYMERNHIDVNEVTSPPFVMLKKMLIWLCLLSSVVPKLMWMYHDTPTASHRHLASWEISQDKRGWYMMVCH